MGRPADGASGADTVTFGSVCSGIEAASVAWGGLGWRAAWFSEIEPFPSAVLAHPPGGGTKWGVAGAVFGPRRSITWRVLDAQFFGLAQRRRRVYVVASARDDFDCSTVLFEFEGVRWNTAPRREAGQDVAAGAGRGTAEVGGGYPVTTHCLRGVGFDASEDGTGRGTPLVPQPFDVANCLTKRMHKGINTTVNEGQTPVIAFNAQQDPVPSDTVCGAIGVQDFAPTLQAMNNGSTAVPAIAVPAMQVRRLTPRECERLQGFPDDYTAIPFNGKPASDSARYMALGNSWPVPVVTWIGKRIAQQLARSGGTA